MNELSKAKQNKKINNFYTSLLVLLFTFFNSSMCASSSTFPFPSKAVLRSLLYFVAYNVFSNKRNQQEGLQYAAKEHAVMERKIFNGKQKRGEKNTALKRQKQQMKAQ